MGEVLYFRLMQLLRTLLFPFGILYGWITGLRNILYEKGWLKSVDYPFPVISVGNLSTGGTGKTPMIEYLIRFLKEEYDVAVLSRGYGRKTKGYLEVQTHHTAREVGDEPLQFKKKFPEIPVAVCGDRRKGIDLLKNKAQVILLDDAFQHRRVSASISILLTPFNELFFNDFMLPTGNLREPRRGAGRADIIVVTKCPARVAYAKLQEIEFEMPLGDLQELYFATIGYDTYIFGKTEKLPLDYLSDKPFTLVTGIARPEPLVQFLKEKGLHFEHREFADHHEFTRAEIERLQQRELLLTTEKDYMRLQGKMDKYALYYLPIRTRILKEQDEFLKESIVHRIEHRLRNY
jgi:tetraacyldisaccharide 4'-kinase